MTKQYYKSLLTQKRYTFSYHETVNKNQFNIQYLKMRHKLNDSEVKC